MKYIEISDQEILIQRNKFLFNDKYISWSEIS